MPPIVATLPVETADILSVNPPWFIGLGGTSIINGTSVNSTGTMDAEADSGSTANGAFRTDGRQSGIGWGGQLMLGLGLFFGEQAVLAMNAASGGSLISGSVASNARPFVEYQVPLLNASVSRANLIFVCSGTNDITTAAIDATVTTNISTFVTNLVAGCMTLKNAGKKVVLMTLPPKPSNANSHLQVKLFNTTLKAAAATAGIRILDLYAALVSVDDAGYASGCGNADNVHATGPQVTYRMMQQCRKDIPDLLDSTRSVLNLRGSQDMLGLGGPNMVTAGTAPLAVSAAGTGMAAALALPPTSFCEQEFGTRGVQASGAGGNAQYITKVQSSFMSSPGYIAGEEFIFTGIVEVTQNNPANTTHNHVVRCDWQDEWGLSGRRVSLLVGPQGTIPKTRLSVLFSPPTAAQMPSLTITKLTFIAGQQSTDTGLLTWRVGDCRIFPVFGSGV